MIQFVNTSDFFAVSNKFVDNYLCEANGSFIKVYLYSLRHSGNSNISVANIANALNLLESDVIRSFKYWDKVGVIKFKQLPNNSYTVEFNTDFEVPNSETESEKYTQEVMQQPRTTLPTAVMYTKSDINNYMKNNDGIRHMFLISSQLLNKVLSDTDRKILFSFYDYLKLPVEVIFTLLEYCVSINKTNMRYIEKVAYTWSDSGINTLAKASSYVKEQNEYNKTFKRYKELFKITGRDFTDTEEAFLKSWVYDLKFTEDEIKNAYEITVTNTGKIAFKYMDAVLKAPKGNENASYTKKNNTGIQKRNSFQNYDDDITDFEVELIQRRMQDFEN